MCGMWRSGGHCAGETEDAVDRALKLVKVQYEVLPAILDFRTAKDNEILVHPEDSWRSLCPVGADNKRNLCASDVSGQGDVDAVLAECDVVAEGTYHTLADQQAMMETFRTCCYFDAYGRLNILSSTQIVFHVRRIISNALGIPKSKIRVVKPRIGGGFGAKQTVVSEIFPAFVTWKTGRPSKMIFSRTESQTASTPRHEMEVSVRVGATKDGIIQPSTCTHCPILEHMASTAPRLWDFPAISPFRCTVLPGLTGLPTTWSIPT